MVLSTIYRIIIADPFGIPISKILLMSFRWFTINLELHVSSWTNHGTDISVTALLTCLKNFTMAFTCGWKKAHPFNYYVLRLSHQLIFYCLFLTMSPYIITLGLLKLVLMCTTLKISLSAIIRMINSTSYSSWLSIATQSSLKSFLHENQMQTSLPS